MLFTASHELTHFIRAWSPAKFKVFADFLMEKYIDKDISVKKLINDQIENAQMHGRNITFDEAYEEVVAQACESFLRDSNAKQTLVALAEQDQTLVEKVISWIQDFVKLIEDAINALKGKTPESEESKLLLENLQDDIDTLRDLWDEALFDARENALYVENNKVAEKNTTNDGDVQMQIRYAEDGSKFVEIDKDLFAENQGKSIADAIRTYIKEEFNNLISVNGQNIQINKKTNDEWRHGTSVQFLLGNDTMSVETKVKTLSNADELLKAAKRWIGEKPNHPRNDDIVEFGRGHVSFKVDGVGYEADVLVAIRKNQSAVLYDLVDIKGKNITEASNTMASDEHFQRRYDTSVTDKTLPQNTENVNTIAGIDYEQLKSAKNENGDELFQYRAIQHDVPEYRALLEKYSDMSSKQINDLFNMMNKTFAIIEDNLEILDYAWDENLNEDGTWDDTVDAKQTEGIEGNKEKIHEHEIILSEQQKKDVEHDEKFAENDARDSAQDEKISVLKNDLVTYKLQAQNQIDNIYSKITDDKAEINKLIEDYETNNKKEIEELTRRIELLESTTKKKAWKIAVSIGAGISLILNLLQIFEII